MKMCEAMASLGHDVELFHPFRHQAALADTDPFRYYGIRPNFRVHTLANWDVVRLERRLPARLFRALFAARELGWGLMAARRAARARPDLVYTRNPSYAFWAARFGSACAFEAHLPPTSRTAPLIRSFARRPSMRAVYALTSHTAAELEAAGVPAEKIALLPDAADPATFASPPAKEEARKQLQLPLRRPIIGYVGRFETMGRDKGVRDLIEAVAVAELREMDPLLLCVGGPMDRVQAYMDFGESLGVPASALQFVDRVPNREISTWLAAIDVGTIPAPAVSRNGIKARSSSTDGYRMATSPIKLFEYMAAGLPIVAADLPGIRDVLDDGESVLLAPPGDAEALGRQLATVLDDPSFARRLGDRARRDAARYTWEGRAQRALDGALPSRAAVGRE